MTGRSQSADDLIRKATDAAERPRTSQSIDWYHEGESPTVAINVVRMTKPQKQPKRRVQRLSPARLLRQKLELPGGITVSAEKHKGRLVVRVDSPQ